MRSPFLLVATLVVLSQNAVGQESRPALPPAPPPPGTPAADDPDRDKPHLALNIPQVIVPDDLDRYTRMLGLSQEQRSAFERMYIAYREDCDKLNREQMPPITRLSLTCGSGMSNQDWSWFKQYQELRNRERDYKEEQFAREDSLFQELAPILTEVQIPSLSRVQMHRERNRCVLYSVIPGVQIDLTELLERGHLPDEIMETIDPTLAEYEASLTPVVLKAQRIHDRHVLDLAKTTVELQFDADGTRFGFEHPGVPGRVEAILERRVKLLGDSARAQQQIVKVNQQFATRVFDLIPEPHRQLVYDEYLRWMHPFVYPDSCDPKQLFDEIVRTEGIDADLRQALQAMWGTYRESYGALSRQMIEATEKSDEQWARTLTRMAEKLRPEWSLRAERWDKSIEFIDSVLKQLPPELQEAFAARVEDYKMRTETFRAHTEHRPLNPAIYRPQKPASK